MSFKFKFCLLVLIWLTWWVKDWWQTQTLLNETKIVFCDVGQGDAIFVAHKNMQLLIDGGPNSSVLACLQREMPHSDHTIETVILTHADADHFSGLIGVFSNYEVGELIINNAPKASPEYYDFYKAVWQQLKRGSLNVHTPQFGEQWCLSAQICVQILSNSENILPVDIYQNFVDFASFSALLAKFVRPSYSYNDGSIVVKLQIDQFSILLTGDAEHLQELALIDGGLLTDVDILKMGHHGSKSSSSIEFLGLVKPEICIVSCGRNNSYGHPHRDALIRAGEYCTNLYRTDEMGWLKLVSKNDGIWYWETERVAPTETEYWLGQT